MKEDESSLNHLSVRPGSTRGRRCIKRLKRRADWLKNRNHGHYDAAERSALCWAISHLEEKIANERYAESEFNRLKKEWHDATMFLSDSGKIVLHSAYQMIIGLGPAVVPFILRDLNENGPDHWHWALHSITRENPVSEVHAGNLDEISRAWIRWGRQHRLI